VGLNVTIPGSCLMANVIEFIAVAQKQHVTQAASDLNLSCVKNTDFRLARAEALR
jgi:hypothetical protein